MKGENQPVTSTADKTRLLKPEIESQWEQMRARPGCDPADVSWITELSQEVTAMKATLPESEATQIERGALGYDFGLLEYKIARLNYIEEQNNSLSMKIEDLGMG